MKIVLYVLIIFQFAACSSNREMVHYYRNYTTNNSSLLNAIGEFVNYQDSILACGSGEFKPIFRMIRFNHESDEGVKLIMQTPYSKEDILNQEITGIYVYDSNYIFICNNDGSSSFEEANKLNSINSEVFSTAIKLIEKKWNVNAFFIALPIVTRIEINSSLLDKSRYKLNYEFMFPMNTIAEKDRIIGNYHLHSSLIIDTTGSQMLGSERTNPCEKRLGVPNGFVFKDKGEIILKKRK